MNEQRRQNLVSEYQSNIELWKHDDTLRQQRAANFLTLNTILVASGAAIASLNPKLQHVGLVLAAFGIIGCAINFIWNTVSERNSEYIRFRRFQLRSIEAQLEGMTTFKNTYRAFYETKPVKFDQDLPAFEIAQKAKQRSTLSEAMLPRLMLVFWIAVGTMGLLLTVIYWPISKTTSPELSHSGHYVPETRLLPVPRKRTQWNDASTLNSASIQVRSGLALTR